MIDSTESQDFLEAPPSLSQVVYEPSNDLELAKAIVQAVRLTPGVLDMSPGRFVLAATYGPGEHVTGVVLLHMTPTLLTVQIHVVASILAMSEFLPISSQTEEEHVTDETPMLVQLAEQIRRNVYQAVHDFGLPAPLEVDVSIDDMQ